MATDLRAHWFVAALAVRTRVANASLFNTKIVCRPGIKLPSVSYLARTFARFCKSLMLTHDRSVQEVLNRPQKSSTHCVEKRFSSHINLCMRGYQFGGGTRSAPFVKSSETGLRRC